MLDGYSDQVQRAVVAATAEARLLGHSRVGTEHLLLGLLTDEQGVPANLLRDAGASLAAARHKVAEVATPGTRSPGGEGLPFTARAQRALERAGRFSRQQRQPEVTAEHLLLGVLDVEGLASQVLRGLGIDIARLGEALSPDRVEVVRADPVDPQRSTEVVRPRCPRCRADLDDSLYETLVAARLEGGATTDVSVVHSATCGETLGVLRPDWS